MTRVKRGNVSRKRHKKILNLVKGFRGSASLLFRTANQQNMKALRYSYANRRKKKRDFRRLWIARLNAGIRQYGLNYSQFIHFLKTSSIQVNRKILAQLSICDPDIFLQFLQSEIQVSTPLFISKPNS
nr:ribosomal protein L20 [Microspora sp. UTEX LB472]